jgi:peptidoglycan/xylan/chitin deacetylase (PgdA/CDA1 family)
MDATPGWAFVGTGVLNTSEKYSGTGSITLTSGSGAASMMSKTVAWNLSADNAKSLSFWVYPHSDPAATITSIVIYAGATSALTDYFQIIYPNSGTGALVQNAWNFIREETTWLTSGWTVGGGNPNWNNIGYVRIQVVTKSGQVSICSIDALSWGAAIKPSIIITSDDGWASNYTKMYPILSAKNMVATPYIISDLIGTNNFMTSSHLSELYTQGWDIGNHSKAHVNFTTLTQAEIETELNGCKTVLDGLGLTRASNHVAYPNGGYDADVLAAMISFGGKTGRSVIQTFHQYYPIDWPYKLHTLLPENTTTLAAVEAYIVETLKLKGTPIISFHEIVDASPTQYQWLTSGFSALIDYIEAQGLQTLTIDEYYRLYSGSITVKHK